MVGLLLGLGQNIKKDALYGRLLIRVRVRAKIENDTLCGWPSVGLGQKLEQTPFVVCLWLELGKKY